MKGRTVTKRIAARTRIKEHLKKRGEDWIEISPPFVMYWWHLLNHAIFGGILQPPNEIHCRNFRDGTYGWCQPYKYSNVVDIGIRRELDSRNTFITVLVHEMVHQYEWVHHRRITHGQNFYEWGPLIKRTLNLELSEFIDD